MKTYRCYTPVKNCVSWWSWACDSWTFYMGRNMYSGFRIFGFEWETVFHLDKFGAIEK